MATSRPSEPAPSELVLSPAEAATLRRFVRRHALAGPAGGALAAAVLLALALSLRPARVAEGPAPAADPGGRIEALEAGLAALRAELAAQTAAPPGAARTSEVEALSQRIEEFSHQIQELRARFELAPAPRPAPASAPAAAPAGSGEALAQRVYDVEARQTRAEAERVEVESQLLARLHGVESRQQEREERDASALRAVLDRVDRLETSRDGVPAAPRP